MTPLICTAQTCNRTAVLDVKWSPDGSRAVFTDGNRIASLRHDDQYGLTYLTPFLSNGERSRPTYRASGSSVIWSEHDTGSTASRLMSTSSSCCWTPVQISPDDGATYTAPDGGSDGRVVFQRQAGANPPEVWIWSGHGTSADQFTKITEGREPAGLRPGVWRISTGTR